MTLTATYRPGQRACAKWPDLHHPIGTAVPAVRQALTAIEVCIECPLMLACRADADQRAAAGEQLDEIAGGHDYNTERAWRTAVYLGKQREAAQRSERAAERAAKAAARVAEKAAKPRRQARCGTNSGYARHTSRKEEPCNPCRDAHRDYARDLWQRQTRGLPVQPVKGPRKPIQHGTTAGYAAHKRRGDDRCDACWDAEAAHARARLAEKRRTQPRKTSTNKGGRPVQPIRHGTPAGHAAHRRREEQPCTECREANARYRADLKKTGPRMVRDELLKPCGTTAAYWRHKRRGEPIDDACRDARRRDNAITERTRYQRNKAVAS